MQQDDTGITAGRAAGTEFARGAAVERFREQYRRDAIGRHYRGWLHFAFTSGACLAAIVYCASRLQAVQPLEWLTIPLSFVLANLAEHAGHRGPMHHRTRGLRLVFERHTHQHHRFFMPECMAFRDARDYKAVLFPPVLLLFFFGGIALPVGALLALTTTANIAWLFAATSIAYFLNYELLHYAYHTPADSWVARLPGIARLRRHHTAHHDPALMSHWNFNISYPLADWLRGTWWHGGAPDTGSGAAADLDASRSRPAARR